ncbi:pro-cathepsin H [Thalassophryne amazonica]|uniref:pro-cathepsin H n=1 Tax=Thalassophryne amazonica TaxID=390379 RepID=UPI00147111FD|nr:pro-cathepsin H [Thalassophryne amazonica]
MLNIVILLILTCTTAAFPLSEQDEFHFKSWMAQYNKEYTLKEYYERLQIFTENKRRIDKHNEGNHSFTMALNQFSDMTFSEFRSAFLWTVPQNCSATKGNYISSNQPYPDSIDWRKKGNYVTKVKNQGNCGSCWTFSTTGCLESVTAIATGKLTPLSEQQLVDCAQAFNNHGCNGGLPSQAFEYIKYNKGIMTEEDYPYTASDDPCMYEPSLAAAFVKDVINITENDEMGMVDAVGTRNPVSLAFDVTSDFMSYHQGVYTSTECRNTPDKVNHAVLAVGYGTENGLPYWIVKNSWGSRWGMNGYFLIERGKNMCGLATCASFPVV